MRYLALATDFDGTLAKDGQWTKRAWRPWSDSATRAGD